MRDRGFEGTYNHLAKWFGCECDEFESLVWLGWLWSDDATELFDTVTGLTRWCVFRHMTMSLRTLKIAPTVRSCCLDLPVHNWSVVSTPLKNISQLGWLFPIYGNKCSKPPTSIRYLHFPWFIIIFGITMAAFFGAHPACPRSSPGAHRLW